MHPLTYPWAVLWGLYYYVLFQLVYWWRFGSLNLSFNTLDTALIVVGILSIVGFVYFSDKLLERQVLLFIPFVIALPFSMLGALGGGLLGFIGIVIGGLVPFAIALPVGYWLIKKRSGAPAPADASASSVDVPTP